MGALIIGEVHITDHAAFYNILTLSLRKKIKYTFDFVRRSSTMGEIMERALELSVGLK